MISQRLGPSSNGRVVSSNRQIKRLEASQVRDALVEPGEIVVAQVEFRQVTQLEARMHVHKGEMASKVEAEG